MRTDSDRARQCRGLRTVARSAVVGLGAAVALGLVLPTLVGWQVLTELTGSMSPVLWPGDLVVVRPVSPLDVRPGDVVTFPDPEGTRRLITHRVAATKAVGSEVAFVTRGDANNSPERWTIAARGRIGRAVYRVPKLGRLLSYTRMPLGHIASFVPPALVLGALEIARIWRRQDAAGTRAGPVDVRGGASPAPVTGRVATEPARALA